MNHVFFDKYKKQIKIVIFIQNLMIMKMCDRENIENIEKFERSKMRIADWIIFVFLAKS